MTHKNNSCRHLTHPYAAFHGCTLTEVFIITSLFFAVDIFVAMIPYLLIGYGYILYLLFLCVFSYFVLVRFTCKKLGKMRKHRPAGFITLKCYQFLSSVGIKTPYIVRCGIWATRRHHNV